MTNLAGKTAIVTGATRGIGLAVARALLERKVTVVLCARNPVEVEHTVASLRGSFGNNVSGIGCDVSNPDSVKSLFDHLKRTYETLDILINNAGVGLHRSVDEMTVEEWNATLSTNLSGVFYCCHEAIPMLKGKGGYIINIGSLAGKHASAGSAAYCASKFGLVGFTESLMQEVRYDHIRVSLIMPGSVNTSFGRGGGEDPSNTWKLVAEDVAEVVVNALEMEPRALPSQIELRPSEPKKKS